ncbi:hypothetical protein QFC22_004060 [Naganishia vaughanmartiniae]|uniref:Uncharacterized protein n=1 Tax=Naganishia vaughanmartiniae TaxID=1424756 RepID=A0ACC2X405_9TREE|nr:hypothetical protein QFC22_004060 [Naganishia vaughanmartiniae]
MAFLNNPAVNHSVHLAILGAFLFFSFVTLAISAAFIAETKSEYYGLYYDGAGLILAASIFSCMAAITFIVFNTIGNMYHGRKNSIMVELIIFSVLFILTLAGAAALSSDGWQFDCSFKACHFAPPSRLAKSTLAFAWLSTLTLLGLLTFLIVWILIHRRRRGDGNIMMTSIKAHHVDGPFQSGGATNMANLAPAATVA